MTKRAPALGRKVKPGPIEHLADPVPEHLRPLFGTYVSPTRSIPFEVAVHEALADHGVPGFEHLPAPETPPWTVTTG